MTDAKSQYTAILIDDDASVRASIEDLLEFHGLKCVSFPGGKQFFDFWADELDASRQGSNLVIDLALVDLRLEGESGLTVAMQLKEKLGCGIIMLTGVGDEIDKIVGLETGADDYVMKPFNPRELVARIRAVIRRRQESSITAQPKTNKPDFLLFGQMKLDRSQQKLYDFHDREIPLTNLEYKLLAYFANNPDKIISRLTLLEEMGSDISQYVDRSIDVNILRLRRKIEADPSKPQHLQTRRGRGYIFVSSTDS